MSIARRLLEVGEAQGSERARRRAILVGRCSDPENIWIAERLQDETGDDFDAYGVKWSCCSMLCPHCMKRIQARAYKQIVGARERFWKLYAAEIGKRERFVTLTGPTLQDFTEDESEKVYNRAFELLSYRPFYSSRVDAGAKHVEFTYSRGGFHTHIHLLLYGRYIERDAHQEQASRAWREQRRREQKRKLAERGMRVVKDELPPLGNLQDTWTECFERAAAEAGRVIEWDVPHHPTLNYDGELKAHVLGSYCLLDTREEVRPVVVAERDGAFSRWPLDAGEVIEVQPTRAPRAGVDVRAARDKGAVSESEISLHDALKELTKYITKASSWSDVTDEQLLRIAEVKRWPRRFELLGGWRRVPTLEEFCAAVLVKTFAPLISFYGLPLPGAVVRIKWGETWTAFVDRAELVKANKRSYAQAWEQLQSAAPARRGDTALVHTEFLSRQDGGHSPPDEGGGAELVKPRAPSLMTLGETMEFKSWLALVRLRVQAAQRARERQLARKYPLAQFRCLDGSTFDGVEVQSERRAARMDAVCHTIAGPY